MNFKQKDDPVFPIAGPTPFSSLGELLAFRDRCMAMLETYPGHEQWTDELHPMDEAIAFRERLQ